MAKIDFGAKPTNFPMTNDSRQTALLILNKLDSGNLTLDRVMEDILGEIPVIPGRDRALLNAIVYGVLRWRGSLDWIIGYFSKTRLDKIEPDILNILRIGVFQLKYLNRIPASAAVNTSVAMAKSRGPSWITGYVNGVLRNASRKLDLVPFPSFEEEGLKAVAISSSFPGWIVKRWSERFGMEDAKKLCDACNLIPMITIRTNTMVSTRAGLIERLRDQVGSLTETKYSNHGICLEKPGLPIAQIREFRNGEFQVQDEAAQLVGCLVSPLPGMKILDGCAGIGGKTIHLAQLMKNQGRIVALDFNSEKLEILDKETRRLGINSVETLARDLGEPGGIKLKGSFDRILLDAPCSGLGVIRRNPDTKWSASLEKIKKCGQRQRTFLDNLAPFLNPGGLMIYSVCSFEKEENEDVVEWFLKKNSDFKLVNSQDLLPMKTWDMIKDDGYFRSFPHLHGMDGFFAACLKRE